MIRHVCTTVYLLLFLAGLTACTGGLSDRSDLGGLFNSSGMRGLPGRIQPNDNGNGGSYGIKVVQKISTYRGAENVSFFVDPVLKKEYERFVIGAKIERMSPEVQKVVSVNTLSFDLSPEVPGVGAVNFAMRFTLNHPNVSTIIMSVLAYWGDFNRDGYVDLVDFVFFRNLFNSVAGDGVYDVVCDYEPNGIINQLDYNAFKADYDAFALANAAAPTPAAE